MDENEIKEKHQETKEPKIDWEGIAKYKAAELENYIKRHKDSVQNSYNDGRTSILLNFLPLGDSLSEAIRTIKDENDRIGVQILTRKFESILIGFGVEIIDVKIGDKFDPYIHQCVSTADDTKNKITEILGAGYKFSGRVVRPAIVRI
jgi:molecular chaperone GrpE